MTSTTIKSQVSGRTYQIEVTSVRDDQIYFEVFGFINGKRVMRDYPVDGDGLLQAFGNMEAALERYLDGQHHPTHYAQFPELVR